jgi:hypothetical protein
VFSDMHRELRAWNPDIPESPERLDPILRIMLELYANQLADIDARVSRTWEMAEDALVKSLSPGNRRSPVPAHTVMRCLPLDAMVEIDPNTRFYYRERREGAKALFFSSLRKETILAARTVGVVAHLADALFDLSPEGAGAPPSAAAVPPAGEHERLYVAVESTGPASNFAGASLFIHAPPEAARQLCWSRWYPSSGSGGFYEDSGFCPGLTGGVEAVLDRDDQPIDWGGFRTNADIFPGLRDNFAVIPQEFADTWEPGPVEPALQEIMNRMGMHPAVAQGNYFWLRLDLPPGGDRRKLLDLRGLFFDAFLAVNKNELTLFKHTGGNRLVELELPDPVDSVLDVVSVIDSDGRDYWPAHQVQTDPEVRYYSLEERNDKLVLWFDYSGFIDSPPDSLTVTYAVTAGVDANGVAVGEITDLYENHPGVERAENLVPVGGAIPARTEAEVRREAAVRLRGRNRALTFAEITNWALTFDPRLDSVRCASGVERAEHGVRRCIVVHAQAQPESLLSDDEADLLAARLTAFLKTRAPVNTQFRVELVRS